MLTEQHLLLLRGIHHQDQHRLGVRWDLARTCDRAPTGILDRIPSVLAHVAAADFMPFAEQVHSGAHAHGAEANDCDFHLRFLLLTAGKLRHNSAAFGGNIDVAKRRAR